MQSHSEQTDKTSSQTGKGSEQNKTPAGKKKRKWKWLLWIAGGLAVLLFIIFLFLGTIVENAVRIAVPRLTGCDVQLDSVYISLIRGKIEIRNLFIHNPPGYSEHPLLKLGSVNVNFSPASIFRKQICIHEVRITGPMVTYEVPVGKPSNVDAVLLKLQGDSPKAPEEKPAEKKTEEKTSGKTVLIELLEVSDGKIRASWGKLGLTIPLPTITQKDIGKENEMSLAESCKKILSDCLNGVVRAGSAGTDSVKGLLEKGKNLLPGRR